MLKKLRIGSDPEFMLLDADKNIISAVDLLPGTKQEPHPFDNGCSIQVDNVMGELCVPPTNSPEEMYNNIQKGLTSTIDLLPKGFGIKIKASHSYPKEQLDNPIASVFGCDPDYHPYGIEDQTETVREGIEDKNLRSCGGHIHVELTEIMSMIIEKSVEEYTYNPLIFAFVKKLDYYLGIPSLLFDEDSNRRLLYGKAGSHRIKSYGVEYRTLSNFWIDDLAYITWIYDTVNYIASTLEKPLPINDVLLQNIINTNDIERAYLITEDIQKEVSFVIPIKELTI